MKFSRESLNHTQMPDPLWLYKAATSLINEAAQTRAAKSGHAVQLEAHALLADMVDCLKHPERIHYTKTALDPLIEALNAEASTLNDVFGHLKPALGSGHQTTAIRVDLAKEILDVYSRTSALVHLERTGKISEEELKLGAALEVKKLSRYGANGLDALGHELNNATRDIVEELKASTSKFVPDSFHGYANTTQHVFTRKEYFDHELERANPKSPEEMEKFLEKIIPRMVGPDYTNAQMAKENLLGAHLKSGSVKPGSEFWNGAAAIHRSSERMQDAVRTHPTQALEYIEDSLHTTPRMLERIKTGAHPESVVELLDETFSKLHPEKDKIAGDLRAVLRSLRAGEPPLPIVNEAKPSPKQVETKEIKFTAGNNTKNIKTNGHTGLRVGASGLFGLAVFDGLAHLRDGRAPAPSDENEPQKEQSINFARVSEVAIGATGLAAAWLIKDKALSHALAKLTGKGL